MMTRDGTAEPISRDHMLRFFPFQLTTSRIGNLTRLIHTLLCIMYLCIKHIARVRINRVRLPTLLVVN